MNSYDLVYLVMPLVLFCIWIAFYIYLCVCLYKYKKARRKVIISSAKLNELTTKKILELEKKLKKIE